MAFLDSRHGNSEQPEQRSSTRLKVRRIATWTAAVVVLPILLGVAVVSLLINSAAGHAYLIDLIQKEASQSLGTNVHLENLRLHLSTLSVDLYGVVVDGAGPHPNPPLLQVQHVQAGIRVVSVLGRKWYFSNIQVDNPVAQILVDKNGVSNIPIFKSTNGGSHTTVFDLGIRHAVLTNGAVFYNNQPRSLAVDLHDLEFGSVFDNALQKYSGSLSYTDGRINFGANHAPSHALSVQFDATPTTLHLTPAKIQSGKTQLVLAATVNNYNAPQVEAQYSATVDGEQLGGILHNTSIPEGIVTLAGSAQYHSTANHSPLQDLVVRGELTSKQLTTKTRSFRAEVSNVAGHYSLANGDATLHDFRANLLGGEITAQGAMKDIAGNSRSKFDATVHGVSLAGLKRMTGASASNVPVAIAGTLNATATATWGKTLSDLIAKTDATINADLASASAHRVTAQPVGSAPTPGQIPVEGAIHATYTGTKQQLAVNASYIRTAQTNLNLNGTLSKNSSLSLRLQTHDLHEVENIADLFQSPTPGQPPQQLGLAGTASFDGVVRGSTAAPHLTGQLTAQNLQIKGSSWKLVRTAVDASPSQVSLQHAELLPTTQGRIALNAAAQLSKWSFSKASPIQIQLSAAQLELSELAVLAGQNVPVSGTLAADMAVHGSLTNPIGNGTVTLNRASAYGEPISSAKVIFHGDGNQAHANVAITAPAGTINGSVVTNPKERTYSAELTSTGIDLSKLGHLKGGKAAPSGTVSIRAKGEGTFDNPQAEATIQIPNLVVEQQTVSNILLQANLSNHLATAQLTSTALNTAIRANAKIELTGDYPADATLDTQGIPLGPLLAAYAPEQADNISGQTELHATLHGPLKNRQQLEAHVTIPVLNLDYNKTVQLAAAEPIHIDLKNGIVNVQRGTLRGTDTNLMFQGAIPIAGNAPMSVLLIGSVDLHIAQLFNPDLRSSGQLRFNINSYGTTQGPDVAGTIEVVGANVASPDLPVGIQKCNGTLTLTKDRINITRLNGNLGGGTFTAQGGVVLRPSVQFNMGLAARDVRMLYPQGMRETINANLRFTGSTKSAILGGNVNLTDLSLTRGFDMNEFISQFSGGVEAPPSQGFAQNVALNLAVNSTSNVNLVSRTLSVGGSANLQVRGSAAEPVILGRVNLTSGDIILNGNRFLLSGGTIQFVNPSMTQPVVNLTLTTSIQQYNISLRFDGPVEQLRTQYTSDPALPSADIIHLLAFGQTTEAATMNATPANQTAETLVANQVTGQVTSRISKVAGISQLSINPVLAGSNSQNPAGANITIQQRVTGNLFVTFSSNVTTTQGQTVQGQYQVSPRVAVSATRDPNGGFAVDTLIKKTW